MQDFAAALCDYSHGKMTGKTCTAAWDKLADAISPAAARLKQNMQAGAEKETTPAKEPAKAPAKTKAKPDKTAAKKPAKTAAKPAPKNKKKK